MENRSTNTNRPASTRNRPSTAPSTAPASPDNAPASTDSAPATAPSMSTAPATPSTAPASTPASTPSTDNTGGGVSTTPSTAPENLRFALTRARYVPASERWTRNAPSGAVLVSVAGEAVTISRGLDQSERAGAKDSDGIALPPIPAEFAPPAPMVAGERVSASIVCTPAPGETPAQAVARILVSVLGAAGLNVETPEQSAARSAKENRLNIRKLRDEHEPVLMSMLGAIGGTGPAALMLQTLALTPTPEGTTNLATLGATAHKAGLVPSADMLGALKSARARVLALGANAPALAASTLDALDALYPAPAPASTPSTAPSTAPATAPASTPA